MTPRQPVIAERIGYHFADPELLEQALTHRSAAKDHYERLEFLGDAVLDFLAAERFYKAMPDAEEGELTRVRARLVRRQTLAEVARGIGLGALLYLGEGEIKSGGRERDSILAAAVEAVLGAVYLEGGIDACRHCFLRLFQSHLQSISQHETPKDAKTRLQELLQARRLPLPKYTVVELAGAPHAQRFTVACHVRGLPEMTHGSGSSRRLAEQEAARKALDLLDHG
jgi:ribonuclease-3